MRASLAVVILGAASAQCGFGNFAFNGTDAAPSTDGTSVADGEGGTATDVQAGDTGGIDGAGTDVVGSDVVESMLLEPTLAASDAATDMVPRKTAVPRRRRG